MTIEIKNLTKIYPRGKKKALNNVNIEIGSGIFGLIGRHGAGKTTLMRILATIMDSTQQDKWEGALWCCTATIYIIL